MKRFLVPVAAGFLAFSAVVASAASLGGLNSEALGSDATVVAACDTDGVTLDYTTSYAAGEYVVTAATVSGIAAPCVGQDLSLTLADGTGAALADGSAAVTGTSETVTFTATASATAVEAASVLIAG